MPSKPNQKQIDALMLKGLSHKQAVAAIMNKLAKADDDDDIEETQSVAMG